MREQGSTIRSRRVRRFGVAIALALVGSAVATTGTQAATDPKAPKYGGSITVAIDGTIAGFCFAQALAGGPLGSTRTIYESLFERTAKGDYVGYLAQSGTPSPDLKTWTIVLRGGITFSNGEAFNAAVVKQNLDIGRGLITTYPSTGIGVNANIVSVDVVDPLTVKVTLDRAQNDFLGLMYRAGRYVMRAPAQIANTATCARNPIGTGPFKMLSYTDQELVVVKNETYWRKDGKGRQLPYLDKITFGSVKEASQRAAAVRTGAVDVGFFTQGDATFINDLRQRKALVTGYESTKTAWGQWVPNVNKVGSPFKYKSCRLAAAHSIDWKTYNKVRLRGNGLYNGSIVGNNHPMFTKQGSPKFSIALAKENVAQCKIDNGGTFKITLYADTSTQSMNNTKFIQSQMEKAGIEFNPIVQQESAVLISKIYKGGGNDFDFAEGTPAEGGDASYVIPFFISQAFPVGAASPVANTPYGKGYNKVIALGNHSDTMVDTLIYAAQAATTKADAKVKWTAATKYLQENGYTIPSVHGSFNVFVNNKSKLGGVGKLRMPGGQVAAVAETKGLDYTGVWKR